MIQGEFQVGNNQIYGCIFNSSNFIPVLFFPCCYLHHSCATDGVRVKMELRMPAKRTPLSANLFSTTGSRERKYSSIENQVLTDW